MAGIKGASASMDRGSEAALLTGDSIFLEWLAATQRTPTGPDERLHAIAAFARLDPALGWRGNVRRRTGPKLAIRRGTRAFTYDQIARVDADWQEAAGERADGTYGELVRAVADHLLRADTRPDDTLVWRGDPADPWPFGVLIVGATLIFPPP